MPVFSVVGARHVDFEEDRNFRAFVSISGVDFYKDARLIDCHRCGVAPEMRR